MAYKKKSKKAKKLNIKYAVVHVKATFNNTLVSHTKYVHHLYLEHFLM